MLPCVQQRMTAAAVLNDLAQVLGPDLCQQFVTPDMVSLSEDPVFRVRKATALNLHHICRVAGEQDSRDRLLPAYIRLTKDDMYRVRKACTESLVEVSKAVGPKLSHEVLTEVFMRLAGDSQKVVRNGALQHLGPFISTLPGDKISQELVAYFTSTACAGVVTTVSTTTTSANANTSATSTTNGAAAANNSSSNMASSSSSNGGTAVTSGTVTAAAASNSGIAANSSSSGIVMPSTLTIGGGDPQSDDELRLYCAFSFPAVVLTLGPSRWPELRNAYHILTKDQEWNVRKTLSHSMFEVAKILDTSQVECTAHSQRCVSESYCDHHDTANLVTTEDLLPVLEYFLRDVEEVRVGVISRLASILSKLSLTCREQHLHILAQILETTSAFNWRLRDVLAKQLPE
eukprot:17929-Heterococcus_DN1.PRE.1